MVTPFYFCASVGGKSCDRSLIIESIASHPLCVKCHGQECNPSNNYEIGLCFMGRGRVE